MKRVLLLILILMLLASCTAQETPAPPAQEPAPAPQAPEPAPEVVEEEEPVKEPELVLEEGEIEILQGASFDPIGLVLSAEYDDITFSEIDTSEVGEQELVITLTRGDITKEYRKTIHIVRPETVLSWEIVKEGPVFLIHPEKLFGDPSEDAYKSYYEYPVFTSEPADVAQEINTQIENNHIWGVAESFKRMSNSISPEYGRADILQADTTVSQGREAVVVHTEMMLAQYQSSAFGSSTIVSNFDMGTGLPISNMQLLERYGFSPSTLADLLSRFLSEQPNHVSKYEDLPLYRMGMPEDEMMSFFEELSRLTAESGEDLLFLEQDLTAADLEGKIFFVEDGMLYSEFIVFYNQESAAIRPTIVPVWALE